MSILKTVIVRGSSNIREVCDLFRKNNVKHWPIRAVQPGVYEITLEEDNPMLSYLLLRYVDP
jgi:hypothetical protein